MRASALSCASPCTCLSTCKHAKDVHSRACHNASARRDFVRASGHHARLTARCSSAPRALADHRLAWILPLASRGVSLSNVRDSCARAAPEQTARRRRAGISSERAVTMRVSRRGAHQPRGPPPIIDSHGSFRPQAAGYPCRERAHASAGAVPVSEWRGAQLALHVRSRMRSVRMRACSHVVCARAARSSARSMCARRAQRRGAQLSAKACAQASFSAHGIALARVSDLVHACSRARASARAARSSAC